MRRDHTEGEVIPERVAPDILTCETRGMTALNATGHRCGRRNTEFEVTTLPGQAKSHVTDSYT